MSLSNEILISVVIPFYNSEHYILSCVKSISSNINKNYEIVLVDDGSTDNSRNLVIQYMKNFENIQLVTQNNQGVYSARYNGVLKAKGKYIIFVDSDDTLSCSAIDKITKIINQFKPDVIWYDYLCKGKRANIASKLKIPVGYYNINDINKYIIPRLIKDKYCRNISPTLWDKVILKTLFLNNTFCNSSVSMGEDFMTLIPIILKSKSFYVSKDQLYFFSTNSNSVSNKRQVLDLDEPEIIYDTIKELTGTKFNLIYDQMIRKLCHVIFNRCVSQYYSRLDTKLIEKQIKMYLDSNFCKEIIKNAKFCKSLKFNFMLKLLKNKYVKLICLYSKFWK